MEPNRLEHLPGGFTVSKTLAAGKPLHPGQRASWATPKPHISLPALHILGFLFLKHDTLLGWLWMGFYSTAQGS